MSHYVTFVVDVAYVALCRRCHIVLCMSHCGIRRRPTYPQGRGQVIIYIVIPVASTEAVRIALQKAEKVTKDKKKHQRKNGKKQSILSEDEMEDSSDNDVDASDHLELEMLDCMEVAHL